MKKNLEDFRRIQIKELFTTKTRQTAWRAGTKSHKELRKYLWVVFSYKLVPSCLRGRDPKAFFHFQWAVTIITFAKTQRSQNVRILTTTSAK
jgi:hypothetical protein